MMTTENTPSTSAALAQFVSFAQGEPVKPIELKARVLTTHYLFEGPEGLFSDDDEVMDNRDE